MPEASHCQGAQHPSAESKAAGNALCFPSLHRRGRILQNMPRHGEESLARCRVLETQPARGVANVSLSLQPCAWSCFSAHTHARLSASTRGPPGAREAPGQEVFPEPGGQLRKQHPLPRCPPAPGHSCLCFRSRCCRAGRPGESAPSPCRTSLLPAPRCLTAGPR